MVDQPYDRAYWERYRLMDKTPAGEKLTNMRIDLVRKYIPGFTQMVLDVGIGGGRFVEQRMYTRGYDINPEAVAWLLERHLYCDPATLRRVPNFTFWDSLEHIHNPAALLDKCMGHVFVSLPIFRDADHVLVSKHYRKDEHCWYFTNNGLIVFMERFGFELLERNTMEQEAGREGIGTYVFKRKEAL